jgi:hypothetical protein
MKHGKNNSLKQTKHKRQMKYNRCSKTTHKRQKGQIQYGGKKYKPGTLPGYSEILEVMANNYDPPPNIELQKLRNYRDRILILVHKRRDAIPTTLPTNTLIQLKNSFFKIGDIEYDDEIYLKLASLNLERIILDVLHWNPFLNFPHNYEDYTPVEIYGQRTKERVQDQKGVDGNPIILEDFFLHGWWNSQPWWNNNKNNQTIFPLDTSRRLELAKIQDEDRKAAQRAQLAPATPATPATPANPANPATPATEQNKNEIILELQLEVARLQQEVTRLQQEVTRLTR